MNNAIRCTERSINPNLSRFKDSDLRICICLQQFRVSLGISTQAERIPLALASYQFLPSDLAYLDNIRLLLAEEKLLDPSFQYANRIFTVQDAKSTLIPEKLYQADQGKHFLEALFLLNGRECVTQEREPHTKSFILSAFNSNYLKAAQAIYSQDSNRMGFSSLYSRLVEEAFRLSRTFRRFPFHVVLHTRKNAFDLAVVNDGGLLFLNSFPCSDFGNLMYYFLYALNKLKIDLGSTALYLCGNASREKLLPKMEQQVYAITYLPAPGQTRFWQEMPYDSYFLCL